MSVRRTPREATGWPRAGALRARTRVESPLDDLVARCLAHSDGAWEEFLHRFDRLIYATIARVGLPPAEQEEAFQSTVAAIYEQLGRLRDPDRLISWIVAIAWRQSVNRIRQHKRETRVEEVVDATVADSVDPTPPPELPDAVRVRLEQAQQAREALAGLSERCRRLLGYLFFEDPPLDYAEIARREGLPIGSLGPTRARCLEKLRRHFEDRGWA